MMIKIIPPAILKFGIEIEKKFRIASPNKRNRSKIILAYFVVLLAYSWIISFLLFFNKLM